MTRKIDWRAWLNKLTYCYGCGRFGIPGKGKTLPMGWKLLYQPHANAPPGLHACSDPCADAVREAMARGPVTEPLKTGPPPMMDAGLRQQMMAEMRGEAGVILTRESQFVFECVGCQRRINPVSEHGIPAIFDCPNHDCTVSYRAGHTGTPGEVRIDPMPQPKETP